MRNTISIMFFAICLCSTGCHASMTGKVVDAETGKPVDGAVLLVEWLKTKGMIGLTYRTTAKAVELFSDKDGNVIIPGYFNPFAEGPYITIYKPGYVAWNSQYIFPGYRKRDDFDLKDGYVFKLEKFRNNYSHDSHISFIHGAIGTDLSKQKINIMSAIRQEERSALTERQNYKSK